MSHGAELQLKFLVKADMSSNGENGKNWSLRNFLGRNGSKQSHEDIDTLQNLELEAANSAEVALIQSTLDTLNHPDNTDVEKVEMREGMLYQRINNVHELLKNNLGLKELPHQGEVLVMSDLHGDVENFLLILERENAIEKLVKSQDYKIVLTGDVLDRGKNQTVLIEQILYLIERFPGQVIWLRGDHELFPPSNGASDWKEHLKQAFYVEGARTDFEEIYEMLGAKILNYLSYAATFGEVLMLHAGVGPDMFDLKDLLLDWDWRTDPLLSQLVWPDPMSDEELKIIREKQQVWVKEEIDLLDRLIVEIQKQNPDELNTVQVLGKLQRFKQKLSQELPPGFCYNVSRISDPEYVFSQAAEFGNYFYSEVGLAEVLHRMGMEVLIRGHQTAYSLSLRSKVIDALQGRMISIHTSGGLSQDAQESFQTKQLQPTYAVLQARPDGKTNIEVKFVNEVPSNEQDQD